MDEDPKCTMDDNNKYPYLIAVGPNRTEIKCFYIMFEKQPMLVRL